MRTLTAGMAESLAGGATTLARCWLLTRADGVTLGFTDHDRALSVDGVDCLPAAGLEASDSHSELGFAVGGGEVSGALTSDSLSDADLAAGVYDDATVAVWLVDWRDPARTLLLDRGTIGEVRRAGSAFTAEVRGLTSRLDEAHGCQFDRACAADLGDLRCGIDLAAAGLVAVGQVDATDGGSILQSAALAGRADGWCTGGRLRWTSGAHAGTAVEVRLHRQVAGAAEVTLWRPAPTAIAVGDAFEVTAGCDKAFATCRDRFANSVNFRGFPHMPGNDFALRAAQDGEARMDGGSLFR